MENLTPKQEAYCRARASGMSQRAAFRAAYPRALGWKDTSVDCNACKLESDAKVSQRLRELREQASRTLMWELQDAARPLMEIIELAMPVYRARAAEGVIDNKARLAITESIRQLNEMFGIDGTGAVIETGVTIVDDL